MSTDAPPMSTDAPLARAARFDVLLEGSPGPACASTCSLIREGDTAIVVDPGLAPSQAAILDPLRALGLEPDDVTDVVLSHHHPDHALNVALFPSARVHDHWAIYDFAGRWDDVEAEGRVLAPSVRLLRTPGHSAEDISTQVGTATGSSCSPTCGGPRPDRTRTRTLPTLRSSTRHAPACSSSPT